MDEKKEKRFDELEQFAIEVKHLIRETGRTYQVPVSELDALLVKYNISFEKYEDEEKKNEER